MNHIRRNQKSHKDRMERIQELIEWAKAQTCEPWHLQPTIKIEAIKRFGVTNRTAIDYSRAVMIMLDKPFL